MKITWLFVSLALSLLACNLGPLLFPTPTPPATASSTPTLTPTSTETPTAASTVTPAPTETITPTPVFCPKGTMLRPSVNRCFYVTRTPKPEIPYCAQFTHKWACINIGCFWDREVKLCK